MCVCDMCVMKIWKKMVQNSLRHVCRGWNRDPHRTNGPMGTNGARFLVAGLEGQNLGLSNDVVYLTSAEEGGRTEVHLTQNLG